MPSLTAISRPLKALLELARQPENRPFTLTATAALVWVLLWCDWTAWFLLPSWVHWIGFTGALAVAGYWLYWPRGCDRTLYRGILSASWVPLWCWLSFVAFSFGWYRFGKFINLVGFLATFIIGLCWAVWYVERRSRQLARQPQAGGRTWNPFDLAAAYYHKRREKLDQSGLTFMSYTALFALIALLATNIAGCREIYESPFGGGKPKQRQIMKLQTVVKLKFVINPFSSVIFNPPPIENVDLQVREKTLNRYAVGYGDDPGAGFASGTRRGRVRFIRLEYSGGDWDQDLERNSDLNMLIRYGIETKHKVADAPETRRVSQLRNFAKMKAPPFVYMTGQRNISFSKGEVETLREYLLEKRGLLFADLGGPGSWGSQFFALMQQVLPTVEPKPIPLDHPIHRQPFEIPFLPYVAPHGGKDAIGWTVEGRLVAYFHPGDIGDAWADKHAGVSRQIAEYCYQTGINVMYYAHAEHAKWVMSLREAEESK